MARLHGAQRPSADPDPDAAQPSAPSAVDLFAGAGGATQGLRDAGFNVVAAIELEADPAATWRLNHPGKMFENDIAEIAPADLASAPGLAGQRLDLLKACPPCQGFSSLRGRAEVDEARNDLVLDTLRFIDGLDPRAVLLENVRGLASDERFTKLVAGIRGRGYSLAHYVVEASRLGVPQRRKRLVVVAVKGEADLPADNAGLEAATGMTGSDTAGEALTRLHAVIGADDQWHRWRASRPEVVARIAAIPVGGNRFDLPASHRLDCHKRLISPEGKVNRSATGSYGRVKADQPSPTMTTRCTTPACGSFVHPTENRGLSLREAAALQTFPADYLWYGGYDSVERQIGNAVPVRMAKALGGAVRGWLMSPSTVSAPPQLP